MCPYFYLDFVSIIWGSSTSCSKFPVLGKWVGPRSLFILFLPVLFHFIATKTLSNTRRPTISQLLSSAVNISVCNRFWKKKTTNMFNTVCVMAHTDQPRNTHASMRSKRKILPLPALIIILLILEKTHPALRGCLMHCMKPLKPSLLSILLWS